MARRNRLTLEFDGMEELIQRFESLNGDLRQAAENALKASKQTVLPGIESAIAKHHRTGRTEASLSRDINMKWEGHLGSIDVGFKISDGGLPSIFLMYGTPRIAKDTALYNSIYGARTLRKVKEVQKEVFQRMISRRMGG